MTSKDEVDKFGILPQDEELRKKLIIRSKIINIVGWAITAFSIVYIVILWKNFPWYQLFAVFGLILLGQLTRLYAKVLQKRGKDPVTALSGRQLDDLKEEQEQLVVKYFEEHKNIAEKVLFMDELEKKGRFHDAYNLATSLMRKDTPKAVKIFLKRRQKYYKTLF